MSESTATKRDPAAGCESARALRFLHASPSWGEGGRELRAVQLMEMVPPSIQHELVAADGCFDALKQAAPAVPWSGVPLRFDGRLPSRIRAMRRFLAARQPDLLLTYHWGAIEWVLAARLAGVRAVVHHEDGFGPEEVERRLWRRNVARRYLLRWVTRLVVPSFRLAEIAEREWHAGDRLVRLPNGVDTARFAAATRSGAAPGRDLTFVCVGVLRPEKNQGLAVEAFARARCRHVARLVLVGDGPLAPAIRARADALGIGDRVLITGMVQDTAPYYQDADLFLLPSRTEQMPLSLLEAMASSLPVVGTDVGDVAAIVAGDNLRWIVPPNDAEAFARAIDEVAGDAAARLTVGTRNREKVEQEYDRRICYGDYCSLYLDLATGS